MRQFTNRRVAIWCVSVIAVIAAGSNLRGQTAAGWQRPLAEKAAVLEAGIVTRHNILGLYPSLVEVPPAGAPIDITTATPFSDIAHAVCWTSNYLAGASYRYRYLKDHGAPAELVARAKARADELFEAVYRCQRVTGVRGLQARGYFLGHGPVYEERFNSRTRDDWHQGEVDGQAFRWRGDPSHHNYSDAIHGLGQYYDLAAKGVQKERAREAIDALVSYWVDNGLKIHKLDRRRRAVDILGFTDGKTLNTRVMMAIAGAKVAWHATRKAKYQQVYDKLIAQFGVRQLQVFHTAKDFDDAEHVFCHLENLFRIEKDPQLLRAYGIVADGLWANHKDDAQSLFTYIYLHIRPHAAGRDKALADALRSLATWPTDMTIQPRMNSLRPDLHPPYPVNQAVFDNEYIWKGNLLRADGWLSRMVRQVVASREDSSVLAAIDESGDLYISRDGAATAAGWHPLQRPHGRPVQTVDFGDRSRILVVTCADGFYVTTTSGQQWTKLTVPADGGPPVNALFDIANPKIIYAVTSAGVYASRDFGEEFLGTSWQSLTEDLPRGRQFRFTVALGKAARIYARTGQLMLTRAIGASKWQRAATVGLDEYAQTLDWLAADPLDPSQVVAGYATTGEYGPIKTIVQQSTDAGASWTNDMEFIYQQYAAGNLLALLAAQPSGKLSSLVMDPNRPGTWYATHAQPGVLRSSDRGKTWSVLNQGLDIPVVRTIITPRYTRAIFAGTPAGLYVSDDAGSSWRSAHLVLQFTQNRRRELGGAAFLDAYWRARYFGFLADKTATGPNPLANPLE